MLYPFSRLLFPRDTCPVKTLMEFRAGATANGTSAQEVALSKKNRHRAGDQEPAKLFVDKALNRHDVREGAVRGTLFRHGRVGFPCPEVVFGLRRTHRRLCQGQRGS